MARGNQTFQKRQRENKLRERAQKKRERREQRKNEKRQVLESSAQPSASMGSEGPIETTASAAGPFGGDQ
jgi:hypothetical protein